jgi:hypothetical protein
VNQKLPQKSNPAVQPYEDRPVGCPPDPNLCAMMKEELDQRRDTVGRLRELMKKAEKGDKKVLPEIREILEESPNPYLSEAGWSACAYTTCAIPVPPCCSLAACIRSLCKSYWGTLP